MRDIHIECSRSEDLKQLVALDARAFSAMDRFPAREWAELLEESLGAGPARVLVARVGNRVAGALVLEPRLAAREIYIVSLAVELRFRRLGLATQLLHEALTHADPGLSSVVLEVRENNAAARNLYEKLGFSAAERLKAYYADGTAGVVYRAPLKAVLARTLTVNQVE